MTLRELLEGQGYDVDDVLDVEIGTSKRSDPVAIGYILDTEVGMEITIRGPLPPRPVEEEEPDPVGDLMALLLEATHAIDAGLAVPTARFRRWQERCREALEALEAEEKG